jgi:hypothetical protein
MTDAFIRIGAVAAAICLTAACEGKTGAPDGRDNPHVAAMLDDHAPSMVDASGATYFGAIGRRVTLEHGVWTGDAGQRIRVLPDAYAAADINGDGAMNAAVVLDVFNDGDKSGYYLAVLRKDGFETISIGTVSLGNQIKLRGLRVEGRRVVVDLSRRAPTDPEGTFSQDATAVYEYRDGGMVEAAASAASAPAR